MESETASNIPRSRHSLEALGELLESRAVASWGGRERTARLEASARCVWERRLYDGRVLGEAGEDGAWQVRGLSTLYFGDSFCFRGNVLGGRG